MTFKAQATTDLPVFINTDEFADSLLIDGETVACVLEGAGDTDGTGDGVVDVDVLAYCRVSSFHGHPPVVQGYVYIGEGAEQLSYRIVGVNEDQGLYELRLQRFGS